MAGIGYGAEFLVKAFLDFVCQIITIRVIIKKHAPYPILRENIQ